MTPPPRPVCQRCGDAINPGARFCMKCGSDVSGEQGGVATAVLPAAPDRDPMEEVVELVKKSTIGEYEILKELGRGGMASVYLAHDIALDRKVAIKVMSPALLLMGEGMSERFRREARTAANLSHPHIIPIYTVKSTGKTLFFVMKFIAGRSLEAIIKDVGPMPVSMVKAILQQVGSALGYAHRNHIIHRDIKPANIMIDEEGWSVVTDFGIAKVAENRGLTMTGIAVGTPAYMSPEQCAAKDITGKSDQYSLGVVAYEMLTGHQPFEGDSAMAIMFAHFHEQPRPLLDERADCPPDLAAAVMRMLEKSPDRRFGSMEEVVSSLAAQPLAHDDPIRLQLLELARKGGGRQLLETLPPPPSSPVPRQRDRAASDAATTPIPTQRVVDLAVAPARGDLHAGDAMQFTATPRNASGATTAAPVNWASNNPKVASISAGGLLTGHAPGVVTVIATCDGVSATAEVTVAAVPVGSVTIEPTELKLAHGDERDLLVTVKDRRGGLVRDRAVRWTVSPAGLATVNEQGRVASIKEGTAEVTAECEGVRGSARLVITPAPVASIAIQPTDPSVVAGQTVPLTVALADARGNPLARREVTWRSAGERIATVGSNGLLAGVVEGTTQITATAEGRQATVTVRVTAAPVASVTVAVPPPIPVGTRVQLTALLKDARGHALTGREVSWSSAATNIATVNAAGEVTGVAPGSVKVTATCEGHSWTVTIGVVPVPVAAVRIEGAAPLTVGASGSLRAIVTDDAGNPLIGRPVAWSSDSSKVVTIAASGQITARAPGKATIYARVEGREAAVPITVAPAEVSEATTASVEALPRPAAAEPAAVPERAAPVASARPSGGKGKLIGGLVGVAAVAVVGVMLMNRGRGEAVGSRPTDTLPVSTPATPPAPAPVTIATIAIVGETDPVAVGRTRQYAVQLKDSAGRELSGRAVAWISSDTSVLAVSLVGAVTGRKAGTATITVTSEGRSGTIDLVVNEATADLPAPVASLDLRGGGKTLDPGGTAQLGAEPRDAKGKALSNRTVVWNSSNPAVATVSSTGLVTAVGPGTATVVASSEGRESRASFTVNPPKPAPVADVALEPASVSVDVGATAQLEASPRDNRGQALSDRATTWKSSDERIARVDQRGGVTGVAKGTATITATAEGRSASAAVTVNEVLVTAASVVLTAPERELTVGKTSRWSAVARDARGRDLTDRTITWSSSAPHVATVIGGLVTAVAPGTSVITALVDGKPASQSVTVKAAPVVVAAPPPQPVAPPAATPGGSILPKRALQAGGGLTCGIGDRGAVCWGGGTGSPSVISGTAAMTSLGVGRGFACGLVGSGEAVCWGENKAGQLGDGTLNPSPTPVSAAGAHQFSVLAVGAAHVCGIEGSKIWCWGRGKNGQLGEGGTSDRKKPVQVRSKESFTAVAAGDAHTCALSAAGKAFCWGDGFAGQLGFGGNDQVTEPVDVPGQRRFTAIVAGGKHTCAISTAESAFCWGANESGQLGDGSKTDRPAPTAVATGETFASLSAGAAHTCGITSAGDAVCWGENKAGQLGDGSNTNRTKPVAVPAAARFRMVSAGGGHTCGLTTGGEVLCWGGNAQGQLGDGGTEGRSSPAPVRAN